MSSNVILKRIAENSHGTFGVLIRDGAPICLTLELPWKDNEESVSCIPAGTYECSPHSGARFQNVWELKNVPDRKNILIHAGNSSEDTHGCILVGSTYTQDGVSLSRVALDTLRSQLPKNFTLTIGK